MSISVRASLLVYSAFLSIIALANAASAQVAGNYSTVAGDAVGEESHYENLERSADYYNSGASDADTDNSAAEQVTSVSQLSDVSPSDSAFQALQSLVERYGCIAGYPDKTFKGSRLLNRYEFAAAINSCLTQVSQLIASNKTGVVTQSDLETIKQLQTEFSSELEALRGRAAGLETRTSFLENHQFSTTVKLTGEAIFAFSDISTGGKLVTNSGTSTINDQAILGDRIRLYLDGSFRGQDNFHVSWQTINLPNYGPAIGTDMTRLGFDSGLNGRSNGLDLFELKYTFPVGDKLKIELDGNGVEPFEGLINALTPFQSSGKGILSRFGRFNPILRTSSKGSGINFDYQLANGVNLQGAYQAGDINQGSSNDPTSAHGLFNGSNKAIGQLVFHPSKSLDIALTYAHAYYIGNSVNITGATGSNNAEIPFTSTQYASGDPTSVDEVGSDLQYRLNSKLIVGGWFGAEFAKDQLNNNKATIINGAGYLAFPDLGKKGGLGMFLVGVPPKAMSNDQSTRQDTGTSIHVEADYRYPVNDHISITPGLIAIFNPEQNTSSDTIWEGILRTSFRF